MPKLVIARPLCRCSTTPLPLYPIPATHLHLCQGSAIPRPLCQGLSMFLPPYRSPATSPALCQGQGQGIGIMGVEHCQLQRLRHASWVFYDKTSFNLHMQLCLATLPVATTHGQHVKHASRCLPSVNDAREKAEQAQPFVDPIIIPEILCYVLSLRFIDYPFGGVLASFITEGAF